MKKYAMLLLVLLLSLELGAGCASVQKKFTKKKKEGPVHSVLYFTEGPYQKQYSNEYYYKTHYTMWGTWIDEAIRTLGGNNKAMMRALEESYSHLSQMSQYLTPEKSAELNILVDSQKKLLDRYSNSAVSSSEYGSIRMELERIQRFVGNRFNHGAMKNFILQDKVDLGETAK